MLRSIRSFVQRSGHITKRQQQALTTCLSQYQLPKYPNSWDFSQIFNRSAETIIEIGFGMGHTLLEMAKRQPEVNFIGIEVYPAGIGSLVAGLTENQLVNVRIALEDAVTVFNHQIADDSLTGIHIFFPDPWPKKRHHKRRLIQTDFIQLLAKKLKIEGYLYCITDWQDYANHIAKILTEESSLSSPVILPTRAQQALLRPVTKFEQRGRRLGHDISEFLLLKKSN